MFDYMDNRCTERVRLWNGKQNDPWPMTYATTLEDACYGIGNVSGLKSGWRGSLTQNRRNTILISQFVFDMPRPWCCLSGFTFSFSQNTMVGPVVEHLMCEHAS